MLDLEGKFGMCLLSLKVIERGNKESKKNTKKAIVGGWQCKALINAGAQSKNAWYPPALEYFVSRNQEMISTLERSSLSLSALCPLKPCFNIICDIRLKLHIYIYIDHQMRAFSLTYFTWVRLCSNNFDQNNCFLSRLLAQLNIGVKHAWTLVNWEQNKRGLSAFIDGTCFARSLKRLCLFASISTWSR